MPGGTSWAAWRLDPLTWLWIFWMAQFAVLETIGLITNPAVGPLTAHLRPVFQSSPLSWFIAFGVWLWLGQHFLFAFMDWTPWGMGWRP